MMTTENFRNATPVRVDISTADSEIAGLLIGEPRGYYVVETNGGEIVHIRRSEVVSYFQWPAEDGARNPFLGS